MLRTARWIHVATMDGRQAFLRLTDYVSGTELCQLSAEALQTLVCGADGLELERIRQRTEAGTVRFVSTPFPGFHVSCRTSTHLQLAVVELESLMRSIKKAARKQSVAAPPKREKWNDKFYHPLYSQNQHHLIPTIVQPETTQLEGLLPLPIKKLSDAEYRQLVTSPYLSAFRKAQRRLADQDTSTDSSESPQSPPPVDLVAAEGAQEPGNKEFEKELEGCLPGVPGVRQSKDYKRIRRKISEIDALVKSGTLLDKAQQLKLSRRPEYVQQLRHMLLHGSLPATEEIAALDEVVVAQPVAEDLCAETAGPAVEPVAECLACEPVEVCEPTGLRPRKKKATKAQASPAPVRSPVAATHTAVEKWVENRPLTEWFRGIARHIDRLSQTAAQSCTQYIHWLSQAWGEFFIGADNPYSRLSVLTR